MTDREIPLPLPFEMHRVAERLIKSMEGLPFVHMGRDPKRGVDCLGQSYVFHRGLGLPMFLPPQGTNYPRDFWRNGMAFIYTNCLLEQFEVVPPRCAQFGDLVSFCFEAGSGAITHTGILIDPVTGRFQHVVLGDVVRYNSTIERVWAKRFFAFLRYRGMGALRARHMPAEMKR